MAQLRIALAQVNPTVGDLDGNADLVVEWTRHAWRERADLVVFPEMVLTGYPVEDLALRASFVEASRRALDALTQRLDAEGLGELPVVVGYLDRCAEERPRPGRPPGSPQNAAALVHHGSVVARYAKHHLPNYGVFDEFRYFVSGDTLPLFRLHGTDAAVAICEDLWQEGGPVDVAGAAGARLLLVPNGSPYEVDKGDVRLELVQRRARAAGATVAYVNMVGGQDELVFDGGSFVVGPDGELLAGAPRFEQTCLLADLQVAAAREPSAERARGLVDATDGTTMTVEPVTLAAAPPATPATQPRGPAVAQSTQPSTAQPPDPARPGPAADRLAEVYAALVTGVRDYARKNRFGSALLGLSGGVDSALTATVAADALGAERVQVAIMPSRHSSEHSVTDAEELVKRQGVGRTSVPIAGVVEAFEREVELDGVAAENLQARVRGMIVMSLSNQHGHLVLTTGNKSELATGYSTLYGDSVGGFAPLKDVPKTMVWQLARWRNDSAAARGGTPPIPESSVTKPPSAELRPGQADTDSLPDYTVLDGILRDYIDNDMGHDALVDAGHDPGLVTDVIRRVDRAEFKRRQYPPGPKISLRAFGRDRRLPISSHWHEPLT